MPEIVVFWDARRGCNAWSGRDGWLAAHAAVDLELE
jgi:hypothetical protein